MPKGTPRIVSLALAVLRAVATVVFVAIAVLAGTVVGIAVALWNLAGVLGEKLIGKPREP